ncbi:MAG: 4-alpha-glucanotransferase, partial [Pseudolabrys sp.]|nr:4-alpha-glucanotransferase [Pseudolabrys sp.]
MEDVATFARRWGVSSGYHDVFGQWHDAPATSLERIVRILAQSCSGPAGFNAPDHVTPAFQGNDAKSWGLAVQLYAVRSARNWGMGDFGDLIKIIDTAAEAGASAIGLNPLHALFLDLPEMASPYGPSSRLFLNPLYIAVDHVPEFKRNAQNPADYAMAQRSDLVDYTAVSRIKIRALRDCYARFAAQQERGRRRDFENFRKDRASALRLFAAFELLRQRFSGRPWWNWPQPWRSADSAAITELSKTNPHDLEFHEYLQWLAHSQLLAANVHAQNRGMPIGLYLDLAVGVDPAGADAWSNQGTILSDLSVGAPPDEFNPAGQNWGLAPFNPHKIAANDFAAWRELLKAAMRYGGAVRLD